jgi:hypothetical protein
MRFPTDFPDAELVLTPEGCCNRERYYGNAIRDDGGDTARPASEYLLCIWRIAGAYLVGNYRVPSEHAAIA